MKNAARSSINSNKKGWLLNYFDFDVNNIGTEMVHDQGMKDD